MVECNPVETSSSNYPRLGEPLELHHFFKWNDYTAEVAECDQEKA